MTEIFVPPNPVESWPGMMIVPNLHNFAIQGTSPEDIELFLGPFRPGETVTLFPEFWTLAHIMHAAGCFPSVGQAKKNGWDKPVPHGYSDFTIGKRRVVVAIFGVPISSADDHDGE